MPKPISAVPSSPCGSDSHASPSDSTEVVFPRRRRHFSPTQKLRIVEQADRCTKRGELEALLRREGIYSSHLYAWRKALAAQSHQGCQPAKPGRNPLRDAKDLQIATLQKDSARLKKELDLAYKLIELQKKVYELLGLDLPRSDNG
jgi:transposase